ncbi:DUF1801 domain-containing protein [Paraflavitalea sp. CAU 1676]|uniref:DUF1801 domain-containing protein n=1 Tax=Paraflavitalea sp. CAU 1676 TaxID=3032598 RepID=UPI0023DB2269|nr:DUF1801 domain-containing protein [Paraflavitalea sp. CAU 1676]MDF2187701.1 DUF1801 domain-containing protein [Paraflavitalea sp. CAU 1676]
MLRAIDQFFLDKEEPVKSYLLAMRQLLLQFDPHITEEWKYSMPFYYYKGRMFCYLWVHKKYKQPYLGIVEGGRIEHPSLILEKRARMKILLFDMDKDVPVKTVHTILKKARQFYT